MKEVVEENLSLILEESECENRLQNFAHFYFWLLCFLVFLLFLTFHFVNYG